MTKFASWIVSVAVALCALAVGVVLSGQKLGGHTQWMIILPASVIMWPFIHMLIRPARNRYLMRIRIERWWKRQLPLWPSR